MVGYYFRMIADGELFFYYFKLWERGFDGVIWKVEMCFIYDWEI